MLNLYDLMALVAVHTHREEQNLKWSGEILSLCYIKIIRGFRSLFFFLSKNCQGLIPSHNHLCFLAKYVKRFPDTESCWVNHSCDVSWYLDIPLSHHDLFLPISSHSCPTTALAVFSNPPTCLFLCSFTQPLYLFPPCSPDCKPHSGFYFSAFKTGCIFPNPRCQNSS